MLQGITLPGTSLDFGPCSISAGVFDALADLDAEDDPPDTEGVFHHGFDRDRLACQLTDVELDTARVVHCEYPVTATKA